MTIYEQLAEYCDCMKEVKPEDVDELIALVSMATCWANEPCETFLIGSRIEVIDIKDCLCNCELVEFRPFYAPFEPDSADFVLVKQEGLEEEYIPLSEDEFMYSEVDGVFKIKPPLPSCECLPGCGCEPKYKLTVKYDAGYELLPDCMLPLFCEALQYIVERKKCDCSDCQECKDYDDERVEVLIPNAATITNQLKAYFVTALANQYKRQLAMISLCERRKRLWSVVV